MRAFSLFIRLPKSSRNGIFGRHMRNSNFQARPCELSARSLCHYSREQKEKGKALV